MVRQHLSQQGSVARDLCRDTAERLVVGRKDSVIALGERGEEGGTLGGVGDARGDLDERVETGTPVRQPVCTVARGVKTYVRAPSTVVRYAWVSFWLCAKAGATDARAAARIANFIVFVLIVVVVVVDSIEEEGMGALYICQRER